ncbi:MAG TPA: GGDEF domain-containing protein [Clostridiales bacterium]|jgi:diguanylate cyclase (GGDEF)-like protein|nr:GGDEF domain-containing protein [Clostridia bacterium]CDE55444.1 diguanylate cyclase with GAF sensor [Clostridium sp. CAG:269]HCQ54806.1 GGDEF domain-containing protein [Clostridiales bacterium]
MFIIVGILVAIVIGLLIYNVQIHRKIQEFNSLQRQANNLRVLQDFLSTIGETSSVDDKIKKINDILIEKYEIKYSTIVVFDGAEYQIKATNVDQKHWETLRNLQDVPIFKDSIATATPKYITINNENEKLPYQTMEFARAKSAIFFPIYEDNVYIGYWIIESGIAHDFDNIDTTIFEVVKDNIVAVLKTVVHQKTLEAIVRKDLFTGLYSEEYLYGEGKKTIDQYTTSAVCMFRIANIEEINDKYSRKLGNQVIIDISKYIRKNISNEYIFIRYMGPKFVIVFSGVTTDSVIDFITNIKSNAEQMNISLEENFQTVDLDDEEKNEKNSKKKKRQQVNAKLNFVITTYYKGTGMEEVLKKLEQYLDSCDKNEHSITTI